MPTGPVCAPLPTVRHHTTISPPPPAFPRRVIKTGRGAASWSVLEGRNSPRPGGGCGAWRARPALPVRMRQHWCRRAPCAGPWVRLARPAFCQNSTPPTTWGLPAAPWRRRPLWRGVCRARWQHGRARSSDREGSGPAPATTSGQLQRRRGGIVSAELVLEGLGRQPTMGARMPRRLGDRVSLGRRAARLHPPCPR